MSAWITAAISAGAALCVAIAHRYIAPHSSPESDYLFQVVGLGVNLITVSIPGRFDGDVEATTSMQFPWPTVFAPAGFAFAIWGVIYLGEITGLIILLFNRDIAATARRSSRAWLCANIAQSLWCACFRPWALSKMWLSSLCLGATAACLLASQRELAADFAAATTTAASNKAAPLTDWSSAVQWALVQWPRSLHLGWTTAATLVNVNAWVGKAGFGAPAALAAFTLSLLLALALAERYASSENGGLPAAALAVSWALFAVSKGTPVGRDAVALGATALEGMALSAKIVSALAFGLGLSAAVGRPIT